MPGTVSEPDLGAVFPDDLECEGFVQQDLASLLVMDGNRRRVPFGQGRIEALARGARVLPGKRFSARAGESELLSWIAGLDLPF